MIVTEERMKALSDAVDDLIRRVIALEQRVYSLERDRCAGLKKGGG